ncbi:MAG TPA: hypothetical protein VF176_07475 [Solirubrobacterales bacterium]
MSSIPPFSAGIAWTWMNLAVGLRRLGHDVWYVEEVEPSWCVDRNGRPCSFERSLNRELFARLVERFELRGRASQVYNQGEVTSGVPFRKLLAAARGADVLINMAGHVKTEDILGSVQHRVYVDQDPVFTQLWNAEYQADLGFDRHDAFFSVGLNIGTPHTDIPDCGECWHHVLPPVVLDLWPPRIDPACTRFTTVASWGSFRDVQYRGAWYGSKHREFERFAGLPKRAGQELEVALRRYDDEDPAIKRLRSNGWSITDTSEVGAIDSYQDFIAMSRAEIGIAKHAYVAARSGWFSDRSTHYLASGKPVLAQSTGFERCLPTGNGLLAFSNLDEAVAGIEAINGRYVAHCEAARELAREHLDHRKVIPRMLDLATAGTRRRVPAGGA